jgi:ubiquinone/menaquinone biosynthesis C-methylase UbiE
LERPIDTKQAEKAYLRRAGSGAWERIKPFSPPGTDTLRESVRLMHDFAVAAHALDATAGGRVLDLGSGSGWTSEWLRRLNLRVVSLDISVDMLALAQLRPGGAESPLVAADFEALPFSPASFDRALCLNALHHVPNPVLALREVFRVLTDDGRLVLVEPGTGHASHAISQAAMNDFGVLEQDLEATLLMRYCAEAGFPYVTVRPLSYMTGEIELTRDELTRWRTWTRTTRPLRALQKIRRALLEMAGLHKDGLLLEDALSMTTSRILMRHLQEQSVVVASKREGPARREYRALIEMEPGGLERKGARLQCRLRIRNAGNVTWSSSRRENPVRLGAQLLDGAERLVDRDYCRAAFTEDVQPGQQATVEIDMPAPEDPGAHHVKFDLVAEGVAWFEQEGSAVLVVPVPPGQPPVK